MRIAQDQSRRAVNRRKHKRRLLRSRDEAALERRENKTDLEVAISVEEEIGGFQVTVENVG